jgi:hypothetical protein
MNSNIKLIKKLSADLSKMQKVAEELLKNFGPKTKKLKIKWVLNDETYRIARKLPDGRVLQVKSVTDGGGDCHDNGCTCKTCAELNMALPPPWLIRKPLKKTYFADERAWLASLPQDEGRVIEYYS